MDRQGKPKRVLLFQLALGLPWLLSAAYYLLEAAHTSKVDLMYIFNEPLLLKNLAYDLLTAVLMCYWAWLVFFLPQVRKSWLPPVVFAFHLLILPYFVMGGNAVFLRYRRMIHFKLLFPWALIVLFLWTVYRWRQSRALKTAESLPPKQATENSAPNGTV